MKVRLGFVSNSSSASFIIKINQSKDWLYDLLWHNSSIANQWEIQSWLKETDKFFLSLEEKGDLWHAERRIKLKEALALDPETQHREIVAAFLELRWINIEETEEGLKVSDHITMFNEYTDFTKIIQELVFLLTCIKEPFNWEIDNED